MRGIKRGRKVRYQERDVRGESKGTEGSRNGGNSFTRIYDKKKVKGVKEGG